MSSCSSKKLVELTSTQVLWNMRNKHSFNSFYDTVAKKSTECEFIKDPSTQERKNHQLILLCISLIAPLAKYKILTQPHVKIATK